MTRQFVANKIVGSDQLVALSRMSHHGMFHADTCGQVTAAGGMTLDVGAIPAAAARINNAANGVIAGSTVTISAAHATLPRRDIVWVDTGSTFGVTDGTAAAAPAPPALLSGRLALAEVAVAANASSIVSGNISDMRQALPFGTPRYVAKSSAETVNNSTVLQNDNELLFSVFPNEIWHVEAQIYISAGPATPGIQYQWSIPSGSGVHSGHIYSSTALLAVVYPRAYNSPGSSAGTSLTDGFIRDSINIVVGATGGTVHLQWAQQVATVADTIVAGGSGSWLIARRSL